MTTALVVALALAVGSSAAPSASVPGFDPRVKVKWNGDGADAQAWLEERRKQKERQKQEARPAAHRTYQPQLVNTVPACSANNTGFAQDADAICSAADAACPGAAYLVWVFRTTTINNATPESWSLDDQRCVGRSDDRPPTLRAAPAFSERDFRRLPLPAAGLHLEPANGQVLINIETNSYARAKPVTLRTTLLGQELEIEATPSEFTWDYGDGVIRTTTDPGHPYPDMTVTHVYRQPGRYQVRLTTTWTGRYRIEGTPDWLPVPGTAQVASPPTTLEAVEARAVLVP